MIVLNTAIEVKLFNSNLNIPPYLHITLMISLLNLRLMLLTRLFEYNKTFTINIHNGFHSTIEILKLKASINVRFKIKKKHTQFHSL